MNGSDAIIELQTSCKKISVPKSITITQRNKGDRGEFDMNDEPEWDRNVGHKEFSQSERKPIIERNDDWNQG